MKGVGEQRVWMVQLSARVGTAQGRHEDCVGMEHGWDGMGWGPDKDCVGVA